MERYNNKRMLFRKGGKFYKPTPQDLGIGVCPNCQHLTLRHYDGDPREPFPNPRKFRQRCFTCEPLTDAERALQAEIDAAKPKPQSMIEFFKLTESENK